MIFRLGIQPRFRHQRRHQLGVAFALQHPGVHRRCETRDARAEHVIAVVARTRPERRGDERRLVVVARAKLLVARRGEGTRGLEEDGAPPTPVFVSARRRRRRAFARQRRRAFARQRRRAHLRGARDEPGD